MDKEAFQNTFKDSIKAITNARFFSTERGYQGALIAELEKANIQSVFDSNAIIEQEYQKTLKAHGIDIRPDIILHIPYKKGINSNHRSGNFIAIQLKRKASKTKARKDFDKLDLMFKKLDYQLGIFLNIDSDNAFFSCYTGAYLERLQCFSVRLVNHAVIIQEEKRPELREEGRKKVKKAKKLLGD